jgi:hypothetical protein
MELPLSDLTAAYLRNLWVHIPKFVTEDRLSRFIEEIYTSKSRRATVGRGTEWWTEYVIDRRTSLGAFLTSEYVHCAAEAVAGRELSNKVSIWAQSYQLGERIAWHRDGAGDIQLLLCIQATHPDFGGAFCLRSQRKQFALNLQSGDAILFKACLLPHSTTRICSNSSQFSPVRITAVARFFAAN